MWIDGKYDTEPPVQAFIKELRAERDKYKSMLTSVLNNKLAVEIENLSLQIPQDLILHNFGKQEDTR